MRLHVNTFLKIPTHLLNLLCTLDRCKLRDRDCFCVLTHAEGKQISAPVIGSDGRVYDGKALQVWFSGGARHVIPGCAIAHVDVCLRGTCYIRALCSLVQKLQTTSSQLMWRGRKKKPPLHARVLAFHVNRIRHPPRIGLCQFDHDLASPFVVVHRGAVANS